jgi:programmed cell death protein 5
MSEQPERISPEEEARIKAIKESILRMIITSEARQRLANLRMVKPDLVELIENHIIQLYNAGKINRPITDEEIKHMLLTIQEQQKKHFRIRWM